MGQMTFGVLYGIKRPVGLELRDEENYEKGLLDRWAAECSPLIVAHDAKWRAWVMAKPGRMPYQRMTGEQRYVPDEELDNDPSLLGFWVAAGASGKNGLPYLKSVAVSLAKIRTAEPYARAYRNARRRWWRLARWARTQGVDLPKPRLWIAETEVA